MTAAKQKLLLTRVQAALDKRAYAQALLDEAEEELVRCGQELKTLERSDAGSKS